ncbi:ABC transporter substrate-binding protein [Cohnella abietis]|uniref:Iron siderophore-binding protein n=1 Tax=Cohnella abietis TaxID=2507935 RepID=A0A3T1D682_9BACL|nr:iron-siderophore ABC transporter substrate-binding protein [Cohnella abietis]BBI33590.1 iron siderophore-binding protein [Cohnella abietis]
MNVQKMRLSFILSLVVAVTLVLSGCAEKSANKEETGKDGEYSVEHAMGKTVIPATPKRIVVLTNEGTEAVLSLGITPVGIVRAWGLDPTYQHLTEQLKDVQLLGDENQPNLELIASLKPDLILGNKFRQEKIYDQLSDIAPTVFSERLSGDWKLNYKVYADALNLKDKGASNLAAFDKKTADLKAELGDKASSKVSIVRFNPGGIVRIYYNDTFSGTILKQVGLLRPATQDKAEFSEDVGKERIPDMEGDVLFFFTYDDDKGGAAKAEEEWQKEELWKNLDVVKKGNVHKVYDGIWNSSGGIISANLVLDDLKKYLIG